jgi:hypothetical protein
LISAKSGARRTSTVAEKLPLAFSMEFPDYFSCQGKISGRSADQPQPPTLGAVAFPEGLVLSEPLFELDRRERTKLPALGASPENIRRGRYCFPNFPGPEINSISENRPEYFCRPGVRITRTAGVAITNFLRTRAIGVPANHTKALPVNSARARK